MNDNTSQQSLNPDRIKDTELTAVYTYLQKQPATATQTAVALNIYRPNLCRRKAALQKAGHLAEMRRIKCPITKHTASLLTCNPALFPISLQLNLF